MFFQPAVIAFLCVLAREAAHSAVHDVQAPRNSSLNLACVNLVWGFARWNLSALSLLLTFVQVKGGIDHSHTPFGQTHAQNITTQITEILKSEKHVLKGLRIINYHIRNIGLPQAILPAAVGSCIVWLGPDRRVRWETQAVDIAITKQC